MDFYRISNEDKKVLCVAAQGIPAVAFAISIDAVYGSQGIARTSLSIAYHIAEELKIVPTFIDSHDAEEFPVQAPRSLLVGINVPDTAWGIYSDRFLSIGANDFSRYKFASFCDFVLSPYFNPVFRVVSQVPPVDQRVIAYTCAPSHIRSTVPQKKRLSRAQRKKRSKPKKQRIVAVYVRHIDDAPLLGLLSTCEKLSKTKGIRFLITTGHASGYWESHWIGAVLADLSGSEFYDFNVHNGDNNPFVDYLKRADAIIVTDDTVSGLSDAVHSNKPVFLYATNKPIVDVANPTLQGDGQIKYSHAERNGRLQAQLLRQGRIQIFSEKALLSAWRPPIYQEWRAIGAVIADEIEKRHRQIEQQKPFLSRSWALLQSALQKNDKF